jgi:hypothetical protein
MAGQSNALNTPSLVVVDEAVIPDGFWEPQAPRLNRQTLLAELKQGESIAGVALCNPQPCLKREGKVMGFSGGRCGDGSLFGLTYRRIKMFSSEAAEFAGAHRHTLGSAVAVLPGAAGLDIE